MTLERADGRAFPLESTRGLEGNLDSFKNKEITIVVPRTVDIKAGERVTIREGQLKITGRVTNVSQSPAGLDDWLELRILKEKIELLKNPNQVTINVDVDQRTRRN